MSTNEMLVLQGMNPSLLHFPSSLSPSDIGRLVGNSMSVNVLERLLARVLPAADLSGPIRDRWEVAEAPLAKRPRVLERLDI